MISHQERSEFDAIALVIAERIYARPILERCIPETFPQTVKEECDKWLAETGEAASGAPDIQSMKNALYTAMAGAIGKAFCVEGYDE